MGSLPWDIVLHKLFQRGSFPQAAALQEQLQPGSPAGLSSWQEFIPAWALQGLHLPSGHIQLLRSRVLTGWNVEICSRVVHHGLQEKSLLYHGPPHKLQGNPISGAWSSFLSGLGCLQGCFTFFSLLSLTAAVQNFLSLLEYVTTQLPPPSLIGSVLDSSWPILELSGTASVCHGVRPSFHLTETVPEVLQPHYENFTAWT